MKIYIYSLEHPQTNEIRYVGKTTSPKRRYKEHIYKLNKSDHKTNWIKFLLKENLKPIMNILEECEINWVEREKYWITQFDNLTNILDGGKGYKMTDEIKEKISKANKGRKISEAAKEKIRQANLGEKNPMYGKQKIHSKETIDKINKDKKKSCLIDGVLYESISEAAKILLTNKMKIFRRIKSKNFPNYIWKVQN